MKRMSNFNPLNLLNNFTIHLKPLTLCELLFRMLQIKLEPLKLLDQYYPGSLIQDSEIFWEFTTRIDNKNECQNEGG